MTQLLVIKNCQLAFYDSSFPMEAPLSNECMHVHVLTLTIRQLSVTKNLAAGPEIQKNTVFKLLCLSI